MNFLNAEMFTYLAISGFLIMLIIVSLIGLIKERELKKKGIKKDTEQIKGLANKLEYTLKDKFSFLITDSLQVIFDRSKNPWGLSLAMFQIIRFLGMFACIIVSLICLNFSTKVSVFLLVMAVLFFWYPMYFYKATGDEREAEWNKIYEFIWVIKHNLMLYDPAKAYMNTKIYIEEHAPHNLEIIQGFSDFYKYWNSNYIDPYIQQYYPFSVTREIVQIIFNMNATGNFPEESLNSLREFIINEQDKTVGKQLSSVSGQATIYSLPFMMASVIISLMVPICIQIFSFL